MPHGLKYFAFGLAAIVVAGLSGCGGGGGGSQPVTSTPPPTVMPVPAALPGPVYDLDALAATVGTPPTVQLGIIIDSFPAQSITGGTVTNNVGSPLRNSYSEALWPAPELPGFRGRVWEQTAPSEAMIVAYTNIEAAKDVKWSEFYAPTAPTGTVDGFTWEARNSVVSSIATDGVITFITTNMNSAASRMIDSPRFPVGGGQSITYPDGEEFPGTFHGVPGTYKCDGAACAARNFSSGRLRYLTGGTWTFTPDSVDSLVVGVRTDAYYLDFGYWLQTDDSGDSVQYTAGGHYLAKSPSGNVTNLEGSATYTGAAAGLYARRDGAAGPVTAAGRFTAEIELTAYFGGSDIAANLRNSISGAIRNFMDGDNPIDPAWQVDLNKIGGTGGTGTFNRTAGTFVGGSTTGNGVWLGAFYGRTDTTTTPHTLPTSVTGRFTSNFNNGNAIGAFGAERQ